MRRPAIALLACLVLAACGGAASPTPAPSSAAPSSPPPGGEIVGPVILDPQTTSATVAVGRMVVFKVDDPETWTISATPDGIVKVQAGLDDGSATFNPGAEALAPGVATVTLTNPSGDMLEFEVTVE